MKWLYTSRFAEIAVTATTWAIVTLPLWLSPFHPAIVAYFIIAFNIYFLFQAFETTYASVKTYLMLQKASSTNFPEKIIGNQQAKNIYHRIVIPCYGESADKIGESIDAIVAGDYPFAENLEICFAFESREPDVRKKEAIIRAKYDNMIKLSFEYHELAAGEVPGKASNQTWAVKQISKRCLDQSVDTKNVVITIADADSIFPKNYFSYLTHEYLSDPDRIYHFYWAPVLLYNNFWKLPFFVRMQATLSSIVRLAFLQQKDNLIQISTYSTSLHLVEDIGYWDVDIIPEDWHVHLQAFFKHGARVRTIPLFTIVNGDAVYSGSTIKTFISRYEQEKRWAWGVSDVAYAWGQIWKTPHIPYLVKFKKVFFILKNHMLWPTSFFILTVFATITPLVNPLFKRTVMGFILPQVSGLILTLSSSMLIIYTYIDIKVRNDLKVKTHPTNLILLLLQWYILPVVSFVLSCVPALDAHTRMLFGRKMEYKVTEKN